jgi:hypothetical protein
MMKFLFPTPVDLLDKQDWQANERGEINETQYSRLLGSLGLQGGLVLVAIFMILMPLLCFVPFFMFFEEGENVLIPAIFLLVFGVIILVVFAAQFVKFYGSIRRMQALRRDRENRAVRQAQGGLAFEKGQYIARAGGRDLFLPASTNIGGLKPGSTYRFHYLEESGFVLSAEEAFEASPARARSSLLEILAQANKFNLQDLERNRNGELTEQQRRKGLPNILGGLFFGIIPLGILALVLFSGDTIGLEAWIMPIIFLVIFGALGAWMMFTGLADYMAHVPLVVEGVGGKRKRTTSGRRSRRTVYYYVIGEQSFQVTPEAYTALIEGQRYRAYLLPKTKKLLTIEPL